MWSPGNLRDLVRFEIPVETGDDDYGNTQIGWSPVLGPVEAAIVPVRGREQRQAGALTLRKIVDVVIRFDPAFTSVNAKARVVDLETSEVFNVTGPFQNPDRRNRYLTIQAEAGGAQG